MFTDDEIIQSVKSGHEQHFEIIIKRYKNTILNFIHKMISDYDEAQNISQDVFIKIYQTINRYKMQGNFHSYIFTIAKNLTLNFIKKRKRVILFSSFLSQNAENLHLHYEENKQNMIEQEIRESQFLAAIKALKENQKLALILKVYLGFSYKKIAEITNWSIPKIETLISRAKIQLKNKIFLQEKKIQNVNNVRKK